jgi:uncharacterized surface anchored protein
MHGINKVKVISAQQTRITHHYKNTTEKLFKINPTVWFSKTYKLNCLIPKYIHVKVNGNNAQSTHTKNAEVRCRINQELRFLCKKNYGVMNNCMQPILKMLPTGSGGLYSDICKS